PICRTLAPICSRIIAVPVNNSRTANPEEVVSVFRAAQPRAAMSVAPSVAEALALTRRDEVVVIAGSLYLIGEVMELLGLGHAAHERALNEWTIGCARR
ncbi:MAG TPA: hypothetical protein VGF13_21280, partial [Verrucomicrobiae bacterium]